MRGARCGWLHAQSRIRHLRHQRSGPSHPRESLSHARSAGKRNGSGPGDKKKPGSRTDGSHVSDKRVDFNKHLRLRKKARRGNVGRTRRPPRDLLRRNHRKRHRETEGRLSDSAGNGLASLVGSGGNPIGGTGLEVGRVRVLRSFSSRNAVLEPPPSMPRKVTEPSRQGAPARRSSSSRAANFARAACEICLIGIQLSRWPRHGCRASSIGIVRAGQVVAIGGIQFQLRNGGLVLSAANVRSRASSNFSRHHFSSRASVCGGCLQPEPALGLPGVRLQRRLAAAAGVGCRGSGFELASSWPLVAIGSLLLDS